MSIPVEQITTERLERWGKRLIALHANPLVLVAIVHDQVSGHLSVITCEEISDRDLRIILSEALADLERRCAD